MTDAKQSAGATVAIWISIAAGAVSLMSFADSLINGELMRLRSTEPLRLVLPNRNMLLLLGRRHIVCRHGT